MYKYLISLQYDGTEYSGFAKQTSEIKTIYQILYDAIKLIIKNSSFDLFYASRTDAGTHALDQKCLLVLSFEIKNIFHFTATLNKILPITIHVANISEKKSNFDIKNYKRKIYKYYINLSEDNFDIFLAKKELVVTKKQFNYQKFKKALKIFIGNHDFFNFCKIDNDNIKTIRKINKIICKKKHEKIIVSFIAHGFLRYQIRYIIGSSLAFACNEISFIFLKKMLNYGRIKKIVNKYKAPSKGLVLEKIIY